LAERAGWRSASALRVNSSVLAREVVAVKENSQQQTFFQSRLFDEGAVICYDGKVSNILRRYFIINRA
jgi:hypothetical protein